MLYYDENLGTVRTTTTKEYNLEEIAFRSAVNREEQFTDHSERTDDIKRRTWVRVFVDIDAAKAHLQKVKDEQSFARDSY